MHLVARQEDRSLARSPSAGGTQGPGAPEGSARAAVGTPAIALLLLAGLALRLIIAYVLFPGSGFKTDISSFTSWALTLAHYGPPGFYANAGFADYTPGYLWILWLVGLVGQAIARLTGTDAAAVVGQLIKLPAIFFDLAVAYVLYRTVLAWRGTLDDEPGEAGTSLGRRSSDCQPASQHPGHAVRQGRSLDPGRVRMLALGIAALYLFNPVPWYDSALWGQMDSLGALIVLGAVLALVAGWSEPAAALAVLAALVKPQFGLVLSPVVGIILLRRHLFAPGSGPRPRVRNERLAGWFVDEQGPWRVISSIAAGLIVLFVVITPFNLDVIGLIRLVVTTAGEYHYLTVNAYNGWALVADPGGASLAQAGTWSNDLVPLLGPLPGFAIGAFLLAAGIVIGILQVAWRDSRRSILLSLAFLSLAFFVLPTRVHERYLFPIFVMLPLLVLVSRRWLIALGVLAIASFMNLHAILTLPLYATPNIADLAGGPDFRSELGVTLSALGHVGVFLVALAALDPVRWLAHRWFGLGRAPVAFGTAEAAAGTGEGAAAGEVDSAAADDRIASGVDSTSAGPDGARDELPGGVLDELPDGALDEPPAVTRDPAPAGDAAPWDTGAGLAGDATAFAGAASTSGAGGAVVPVSDRQPRGRWGTSTLRRLLGPGSIRADRSRLLHGEGHGRVNRFDIFVMALLVISAMTMRTWRLAEPYGMYFDEIYHARTATEFLQDWRYGMPHSIYEFTHPHLAKYMMALGIVAFGDDRVTGTSQLDAPVKSAAIEPRWSDPGLTTGRDGDRLYVATGSAVRVYDLQTRGLVATLPVPGATAIAVDTVDHIVYVGTSDGSIWSLPTSRLDALRAAGTTGAPDIAATRLPGPGAGGPVQRLAVAATGGSLLALTTTGQLASIDANSGAVLGRASVSQQAGTGPVKGIVPLEPVTNVTVDLTKPYDATKVRALATALGVSTGPIYDLPAAVSKAQQAVSKGTATIQHYEALPSRTAAQDAALAKAKQSLASDEQALAAAKANLRQVVVAGFLSSQQQSAIQPDLQALGDVARIGSSAVYAVSGGTSVRFLDATTLDPVFSITLPGPALGMGFANTSDIGQPTLYVASGRTLQLVQLPTDGQPVLGAPVPMPGPVTNVTWDASSDMIHALGTAPDGHTPTIYVVEPHGNAVYANANLPFTPVAWAMDQQPNNPSADRQQLLTFSASGTVASVDVGSHAFAWRLPGVIAGSIMIALLYLLARILFRRRSVGLIVAAMSLVDGMFFANSRIGMNDIYAGVFIVGAYVVFAALALGRWRGTSALLIGLPLLGLLLGLADASKWVGFYAMGGIGLLMLLRSGLGRTIALGAMAALAGILGYYSISAPPDTAHPQLNVTFLLMMVGITMLMAAGLAVRSVRWTVDELRFAVIAPLVAGIIVAVAGVALGPRLQGSAVSERGLVLAGAALVALSVIAYATPLLLARWSMGPLAPPPRPGDPRTYVDPPADPPRESWLIPGASHGLPWLWGLACITVLPIVVYVVLYTPWVALGNQFWSGFPPGNHGQTLWDLTVSMFNYHNDLRVPHPASSPWWAWPLDLKPVWWYQGSLANDMGASIYDTGNLVLFWLSLSAVPWVAWQAWKRRSLALGIVILAAASQWLPWVWVDRATFQYHFLTTLPFSFLALAYFVAELWHGPARRTWALARVTAAIAILGPAILWLLKGPLCVFAGTAQVDPSSQVCGTVINPVFVTERVTAAVAVIAIGGLAIGWLWWSARNRLSEDPAASAGSPAQWPGGRQALLRTLAPLAGAVIVTVVALVVVETVVPDVMLLSIPLGSGGPTLVALVVGLLLTGPAWLVLRARDPRRFAAGILVAALVWFVVWYPNISALPLPGSFVNMYQGLLPTWIYDFQFTVNMTPAAHPKIVTVGSLALIVALLVAAAAVMYAARSWHLELAMRRAEREGRVPDLPAEPGGARP